MLYNLSKHNHIANQFIADLRNVNSQSDRERFRNNMKRLAEFFAFEISKLLDYESVEIETPLGVSESSVLKDELVLAGILRAGLPLHQGLLHVFNNAENAFISSSRMHHKDGSFHIRSEMVSCPNVDGKVLIIADAVIATGASMQQAIEAILAYGKPKAIHVISAICSTDGLNLITRLFPDVHLWIGAEDEELTAKSYVVPGLGNAGDLSFGEKQRD